MLIQGQVGPSSQQSAQAGSTPAVRMGQQGDVILSELHGRYYETTYRKSMYTATLATATTTTAALATTFTGLVLANPTTSTVNLVINKVGIAFAATGALAAIGLMGGQSFTSFTPTTTNTTIRGNFIGQPAGQALAGSAATLPVAPTLLTVFTTLGTLALTSTSVNIPLFFDLEGSIVVPPGGFVCTYTSAINTSNLLASIQFEEVPV